MPNHVTTRCLVSGPDASVKQFRKRAFRIEDGETIFDFNAFVTMPAVIRETKSGSASDQGAVLLCIVQDRAPPAGCSSFGTDRGKLRDATVKHMREELGMPKATLKQVAEAWLAKHPEYAVEGEKQLRAIAETGFPDWYEWSIRHWGTKWNAYHFRIITERPLEFVFDTAWDFPEPVFKAIAEAFPNLTFRCSCFDEGWGFAGDGYFNPRERGQWQFGPVEATDHLYELVYGYAPETEGGAA
jgi:Ferredoxin-like domain in Api92-like protein